MADSAPHHDSPKTLAMLWSGALAAGSVIGVIASQIVSIPVITGTTSATTYNIPAWLCVPFLVLLACIATGPLLFQKFWHRFDAAIAFFLGGTILGFYVAGLRENNYGSSHMMHVALEYIGFIALVGGLYIASAGIELLFVPLGKKRTPGLEQMGHAGPWSNTMILLIGAVLANFIGTTGASVLLIRPFIRVNASHGTEAEGHKGHGALPGRLRPMHIVFFILIVSNCGGCLTPIGDPPLYLGFIKGIPFSWTTIHLWEDWLLVVGLLLAVFFTYDSWVERQFKTLKGPAYEPPAKFVFMRVRARAISLFLIALIVGCVFVDPIIHKFSPNWHYPVGAPIQIILAIIAYRLADQEIKARNEFSFGPVREVATLFVGIFLTMTPALAYLAMHGGSWGIDTPTSLYWATGSLSAVLDNAPTYLNFVQVAVAPEEVNRQTLSQLLATDVGIKDIIAISTGAVFFGALTYIGNGPNFMVRSIAQSRDVKMPSFFGYALKACAILVPILVIHWLLFIK
ncbi:MAG: sodium:proton antiporter [Phycisphaerales bacterium]